MPSEDQLGARMREWGIRSAIAVAITVEGRSWDTISVMPRRDPLPADTEQRLAELTKPLRRRSRTPRRAPS